MGIPHVHVSLDPCAVRLKNSPELQGRFMAELLGRQRHVACPNRRPMAHVDRVPKVRAGGKAEVSTGNLPKKKFFSIEPFVPRGSVLQKDDRIFRVV